MGKYKFSPWWLIPYISAPIFIITGGIVLGIGNNNQNTPMKTAGEVLIPIGLLCLLGWSLVLMFTFI